MHKSAGAKQICAPWYKLIRVGLNICLGLSGCFKTNLPAGDGDPWNQIQLIFPLNCTLWLSEERGAITHITVVLTQLALISWGNGECSMITLNATKTRCNKKWKCPFYQAMASDTYLVHSYYVCLGLLSCPHHTAAVSAVVYIRANGRFPDAKGLTVYQWKRVVNMGTQPPSWPWYGTIHHLGLETGWGREVYPDGGHLTQVRFSMS